MRPFTRVRPSVVDSRYPGNACVQVLIKPPASPKTHAANTSPGTDNGANPTPSDSTAVITHVTNDVRRGPKRSMTEPDTILPADVIRLRTSVMAATKNAVPARSYVAAPISPKKYTALLAHHCRDSIRISLTSAGVRRIASRSFANIRTPSIQVRGWRA